MGSGGSAVERRTVNRRDGGSIPPIAISKLRNFVLGDLFALIGLAIKMKETKNKIVNESNMCGYYGCTGQQIQSSRSSIVPPFEPALQMGAVRFIRRDNAYRTNSTHITYAFTEHFFG